MLLAGLLAVPNYNLLLGSSNPFTSNDIPPVLTDNLFAHLPPTLLIWAGFIALILLFRRAQPAEDSQWDIPPWSARLGFWFFMILGSYLRLENIHQPPGWFWDDHYTHTSDIRNILDLHNRYLLFPSGWREPFFPYLTASIWLLLPSASGQVVMLLSNTVIDMTAVWLFYLLGKEIGGRRMGVILLAMGATCKTMIMVTRFEYGNDTCVLGAALALLFFLRLLKKPDWIHFLEWGLTLGFGGYTYVPFRPWAPLMLGIVFIWVALRPKERRFDFHRAVIGPGFLGAWAVIFMYKNSFLPPNSLIMRGLTSIYFLAPVAVLLGWSFIRVFRREKKKGFSRLFGWASGALAALLLMAPLYLHLHYFDHVSNVSAWSKEFTRPGEGWLKVWKNIFFTWQLLFQQAVHPSQLPAIGDSLYEFLAVGCALLGLASFIARPRWVTSFVLLLFVTALLPGVISNAPHSFRYVICDLPILVTGAWGVNRLWLAMPRTAPAGAKAVFLIALLSILGWEVDRNHWLTWTWMAQRTDTTSVWDQAQKELPDHRVYMVKNRPNFYTIAMDILADGQELFQTTDSNSIDLPPGEKGKDLAVLLWGGDVETQRKIEEEFPGLQWNKHQRFGKPESETPYLWWAEIPFDRVPVSDQGFFHARLVPEFSWRRRWYGHYGMGRGLILNEDRVFRWNDQLPAEEFMDCWHSGRVEGNWYVSTGGKYTLKMETSNLVWFFVDGKKILDIPADGGTHTGIAQVDLAPGNHRVEMVLNFTWEKKFPRVSVVQPGSAAEIFLDDLTSGSHTSTVVSKPAHGTP